MLTEKDLKEALAHHKYSELEGYKALVFAAEIMTYNLKDAATKYNNYQKQEDKQDILEQLYEKEYKEALIGYSEINYVESHTFEILRKEESK